VGFADLCTQVRRFRSVRVFGCSSHAKALYCLFSLFFPKSYYLDFSHIESETFSSSASITVLAYFEQGCSKALIEAFLNLRVRRQWRHPVLIISNPTEVDTIKTYDYFLEEDRFATRAQACITSPTPLSVLLDNVALLRSFMDEAWKLWVNTYHERDVISTAHSMFQQLHGDSFEVSKRIHIIKNLVSILLDRELVLRKLIGHDVERTLNDLKIKLEYNNQDSTGKHAEEQIFEALKQAMVRLPRKF